MVVGSPTRLALWVLIVLGASEACLAPTQVTLTLVTDVPCDELGGVAITVGIPSELETRDASTEAVTCKDGTLGTLVVVPHGDRSAEFGVKVVASRNVGLDACGQTSGYGKDLKPGADPAKPVGCIVARRRLRFIEHQPHTLMVELRSVCSGNPCDPNSTCVEGVCTDATCPEGTTCDDASLTETAAQASDGVLSVAAGFDTFNGAGHSCAVLRNGTVRCWGDNTDGQLGVPASGMAQSLVPFDVPNLVGATQVVAGADYSCALLKDGTVMCWGKRFSDSMGKPTLLPKPKAPVTRLSAAATVVCGDEGGTQYQCWAKATVDPISRMGPAYVSFGTGRDEWCLIPGNLPSATNVPQCQKIFQDPGSQPPPIVAFNWTGVATNMQNAVPLAIVSSRSGDSSGVGDFHLIRYGHAGGNFIVGVGANNHGQLGAMPSNKAGALQLATLVFGAGVPQSVYAGGAFACADITLVGKTLPQFQCWGDDQFGQLGATSPTAPLPGKPRIVEGLPTGLVKDASLGSTHACVVASDGNAYCWGCGASGQLGDEKSGASCDGYSRARAERVTGLGP